LGTQDGNVDPQLQEEDIFYSHQHLSTPHPPFTSMPLSLPNDLVGYGYEDDSNVLFGHLDWNGFVDLNTAFTMLPIMHGSLSYNASGIFPYQ
jgi:hypothetical protein